MDELDIKLEIFTDKIIDDQKKILNKEQLAIVEEMLSTFVWRRIH